MTGYELWRASPAERPELVRKQAITTGTSIVATDLAVGVAFMLGATGVGLIAVGLVAGMAAAYGVEQLYFAHQDDPEIRDFHAIGVLRLSKPLAKRP